VIVKAPPMTVPQFLDWAAAQPAGRYELENGRVLKMSPERNRHVDVKMVAWLSLRNAISRAKVPFHASGDGITVVIDEHTAREPDVTVQSIPVDPDALTANEPVIVVEVVSPSSERSDTGAKVAEYFRVPSIRHYLIVDPRGRSVIRHSRRETSPLIDTEVVTSGDIELSQPGITIPVAELLGEAAE
jgi:Uma2 family endonuclease